MRHAEYKVPGGKLVVVDLEIQEGRFHHVQLSGDFFLEPPEVLEQINQALEGVPIALDHDRLTAHINQAIPASAELFGIHAAAIATVLQRTLTHD